jgi:hypothetical protein
MSFLSTAVHQVLDEGQFCVVATDTPNGPHGTPLVFALSGGRIWLTTSRGSVKARAWRTDPTMAGLVRSGDLWVAFTGTVRPYDLLDSATWGATVSGAPAIARASVRFSKKNARFFAGYAMDARQVPFAWTPPGRVFVGIDIERTALLDKTGVSEGKGRWAGELTSKPTFRATKAGRDPLAVLPLDVSRAIGREGHGSIAIAGPRGPVALPARWRAEDAALYVALPAETLALADTGPDAPVALTIDRPSAWRARDMTGAMVQGTGTIHAMADLGSGKRSAAAIATSIDPDADALIRIEPRRLVWWKGWTSGSVLVGP